MVNLEIFKTIFETISKDTKIPLMELKDFMHLEETPSEAFFTWILSEKERNSMNKIFYKDTTYYKKMNTNYKITLDVYGQDIYLADKALNTIFMVLEDQNAQDEFRIDTYHSNIIADRDFYKKYKNLFKFSFDIYINHKEQIQIEKETLKDITLNLNNKEL